MLPSLKMTQYESMSERKPTPRRTAASRPARPRHTQPARSQRARRDTRASVGVSASRAASNRSAHGRVAAASKPKARRLPSPLDNQVRIPLPEGERTLTRRQLLVGAVGIGALIAVGAGAQAVSKSHEAASAVDTIEVPADAVASLSGGTYAALDGDAPLALAGEYKLPYGTLVWANCDSYAACLLPTEGADPLTQAGIVSLADGAVTVALPEPASSERGFDIYDVRCDEHGMVWVEANCLSGEWRIYQAPHSKGAIGSALLVDPAPPITTCRSSPQPAGGRFGRSRPMRAAPRPPRRRCLNPPRSARPTCAKTGARTGAWARRSMRRATAW